MTVYLTSVLTLIFYSLLNKKPENNITGIFFASTLLGIISLMAFSVYMYYIFKIAI
jgi:hypothetical protein